MRIHWFAPAALALAAALTGCGDNGSSLNGNGQPAQTKRLVTQRKAVASDYQTEVQALYVAYFGRPADPTGLANFESALLAAGAPTDIQSLVGAYSTNPAVQTLINSFGTSKESQSLYGTGDPTGFVNAVFQHVLGRAPASSGLNYWVGAISSGQLSQGDAALAIMAGALANNSAQGLIDAQLVDNRLSVATSFTAAITTPATLSSYSGAAAAQTARNMLSAVTNSTDIGEFQATIYGTLSILVSSNTSSFPIDAAQTAFYQSPQSFNASFKDASGNNYVLTYAATPNSGNTTFAGQAAKSASVTVAISENGKSLVNEPTTVYYQTGPFKLLGQTVANSQYVVASNQVTLPAFAAVGASDNFYTSVAYADSSMRSVLENIVSTWNLASSPVAGTAEFCNNGVVTLASGATSTSAVCYQVNISGQVLGLKLTLNVNGTSIVFDSSATSSNPVTVPTPTSQGCGGNGGSGYEGVSFIDTVSGTSSYFRDSNNYAGQEATETLYYGLGFDNANYPSSIYSGSLRVQIWAFPTSYSGTVINGYLMGTLFPNFSGTGAYSSNQLYNFYSANAITSTGAATNPPAGTYCVAALLLEYTQDCGSNDGYCTIDWRNVINPQTYY